MAKPIRALCSCGCQAEIVDYSFLNLPPEAFIKQSIVEPEEAIISDRGSLRRYYLNAAHAESHYRAGGFDDWSRAVPLRRRPGR